MYTLLFFALPPASQSQRSIHSTTHSHPSNRMQFMCVCAYARWCRARGVQQHAMSRKVAVFVYIHMHAACTNAISIQLYYILFICAWIESPKHAIRSTCVMLMVGSLCCECIVSVVCNLWFYTSTSTLSLCTWHDVDVYTHRAHRYIVASGRCGSNALGPFRVGRRPATSGASDHNRMLSPSGIAQRTSYLAATPYETGSILSSIPVWKTLCTEAVCSFRYFVMLNLLLSLLRIGSYF